MPSQRTNYWQIFITLVVFGGVLLRFLNLGSAPLSDSEARWALDALNVAEAGGIKSLVSIGPQPAYIFLTSLLFKIIGDTNFSARFWPALSGSLLILAPLAMQKKISKTAAAIMLIGLALNPGLVTVSRQAGGPMMAAALITLAFVAYLGRRSILSGVLAGAALLSGQAIYPGLIALGLTWLLAFRKDQANSLPHNPPDSSDAKQQPTATSGLSSGYFQHSQLKKFLIALFSTIFILGTCLLQHPQGLAAWAQSLVAYLSGWIGPTVLNPLDLLSALLIFEFFAVIFAILSISRWLSKKEFITDPLSSSIRFSALNLMILSILILIYPARQVSDLIWLIAPLWYLASIELRSSFQPHSSYEMRSLNVISALQAGLIIILASLLWFSFVSSSDLVTTGAFSPQVIRLVLLIGIISLGVISSILIALGWSPVTSRLGAVWGLSVIALVSSISGIWSSSQLRVNQPEELWAVLPGTGQQDLMLQTLQELSNWNTGIDNTLQIVSVVDWPSIRWELRDFVDTEYVRALPTDELPAVIISTLEQEEPALSSAYRGQDFVWRTWPDWEGLIPTEFFPWLTFRSAPILQEKIILWARSDQFPGGSVNAVQDPAVNP